MPIIGYSDEQSIQLHNALPTFGKLKKGGEKGDNRPGQDLDYYRVDFDDSFAHLESAFTEKYGNTPRTFENVMLPSAMQESVFDSWYQAFGANKTLKTQCDGKQQTLYWVEGKGYSREPKPCAMKDGVCPNQCDSRGYLLIILPDFCEAVGQLGFFTVQTSSLVDIQHIASVLAFVSGIGELDNQRYTLTRTKKSFTPLIKGKRAKVEKWMILLQPQSIIPAQPALPAPQPAQPQLPDATKNESESSSNDSDMLLQKFADTVKRYLEGVNVVDIFRSIDIRDAKHFVDRYPTWNAIRGLMIQFIVINATPVRVYGCITSRINQGQKETRRYDLSFGFAQVPLFGRKLFREAGYNVDDDYWYEDAQGEPQSDSIYTPKQHLFAHAIETDYIVIKIEFNGKGNLTVSSIADNPNEDFIEGETVADTDTKEDPLSLGAHGLDDNPLSGYGQVFDEQDEPPQFLGDDNFPM